MATFMLLLKGDTTRATDEPLSPAQVQAIIEKYVEWSTRIEADGHYVASDKLRAEPIRTLEHVDGSVRVMDGPYSEAKEVVAGYFVIEADDLEQAEVIARGCPHLSFGGVIQIREIEPRVREEMEQRGG